MYYRVIAISGEIGTGKSTLSKNLAKILGWEYINAGDFFRNWHKENNIPLSDSLKVPPELDKKIDADFIDKMTTGKNTIFESRLAGWLAKDIPDVFKILVTCEFEEAMKRTAKRETVSIAEAKTSSQKRSLQLQQKFQKLYLAKDFLNPKYFNLVIDTTNISPEASAQKVITEMGL
jgi:CMP/dCMP kinase